MLEALHAAHEAGVVHRDVKPANILDGPNGPRLCDFGLASMDEVEQSHTRLGTVGTQSFIAPEQRRARATVDARADVWSATVTLVAMLLGEPEPEDLSHDGDREESLGRLDPDLRRRVEAVVVRGSARRPEARYGSARELAEALSWVLAGAGRVEVLAVDEVQRAVSGPAVLASGAGRVEVVAGDLVLPLRGWWATVADQAAVHGVTESEMRERLRGREGAHRVCEEDGLPRHEAAVRLLAEEGVPLAQGCAHPAHRLVEGSLRGLQEGVGQRRMLVLPGGVDLPLRWIPGGRFLMGSPEGVGHDDERPRHSVVLSQGFWLGETAITQAQWSALAEGEQAVRKARFTGAEQPMETVSWEDCQKWLKVLGGGARLPTEAEWERACRAGTDTHWSHGDEEQALKRFAWYGEGPSGGTHPVGQKAANPWGLYDVYGNVWEWCQDDWGRTYDNDEALPSTGRRQVRGGSYWEVAGGCRSAYRGRRRAGDRSHDQGFRVLLPGPGPSSTT